MTKTQRDRVFSVGASNIVFGPGARHELGDHAIALGLRRVLLFTDSTLAAGETVADATASLRAAGIEVETYDTVSVEPTDRSFQHATEAAQAGEFDGFVAIGGGSSMDTAKAANLYATYPDDFLAYVNPPIGRGMAPPGPLRPLICLPTTAGTGSETTGVAVFDLLERRAKTGIAHRLLRPTLGIVDPETTLTMPPMVTAASGFDVLSHALESYTALRSVDRAVADPPAARPAYQGANPFSDIWAEQALTMVARSLPRALADGSDIEARTEMSLAATFAGIGFGNAGVHLPHGMSYAVSGMVRDYRPVGYPAGHAIVPHGMSVVLDAPAVVRFTATADPERHLRVAELLGADIRGASADDAGDLLSARLIHFMRLAGMPNGLAGVGYGEDDINALVEGTLPQQRVTKLSPRSVERDDLATLFRESLQIWP
jgi:hydroxyacid-oxoacid transhydrogenase